MLKVTIVYPTDPLGVVPGGIDTCIRDILRFSPDDIQLQLFGVTTDPVQRPPGRWTECEIDGNMFCFFPVLAVSDLEKQMRIPLSLQFTLRLFGCRKLFISSDVIQFNRIEPTLSLLNIKKPKVLIIHQYMNVLKNKNSDIRWKYFPGLYFAIENFMIKRLSQIFIVRKDAVEKYRQRFPAQQEFIQFLPTWMNHGLFFYLSDEEKQEKRLELLGFENQEKEKLLIFVGRLDHQKDPLYLVESLYFLSKKRDDWKVLIIGDGVLRAEVELEINRFGLGEKVLLLGAITQDEVANYMRVSDVLLLSSAYEGMPRCVVEALGCGVPVVTTKAGEVTLLINQGKNGYIVEKKNPKNFSDKIVSVLDNLNDFKGAPCLNAVQNYRADKVLEKLYQTYRNLAECK